LQSPSERHYHRHNVREHSLTFSPGSGMTTTTGASPFADLFIVDADPHRGAA